MIHDASIDIVFDPKTKRLRARYEGRWVRFPKKLRRRNASYIAEELREGKSGSWIACGTIVEDERLPLEKFKGFLN